jgi:hypothetical protein
MRWLQLSRIYTSQAIGVDDGNRPGGERFNPTYFTETMLANVSVERKRGERVFPRENFELVE